MSAETLILARAFLLGATLYSSVGHAGASGYLAAMAFLNMPAPMMRPTALVLNLLVASIATIRFARAGWFSWTLFWPFALGSIPFAFLGGAITVPGHWYRTLVGLVLLSKAASFPVLLMSAAIIGIGSSIFHPESSRLARLASGGRHGFAQSLFQVGGNAGSAVGPLAAAFIVLPNGQDSVAWFALAAMLGIGLLVRVGGWYTRHNQRQATAKRPPVVAHVKFSRGQVITALGILVALIFSKYFYLSSFSSYYTFYLIHKFDVSVWTAQVHLFVFLASVAAGTFLGGPIGDRIGRKYVIWFSILGVLPFTLVLPHVNLFWTGVLTVPIGLILASAFSAILVYAQELVPGKVGMISGLFFGIAFGMGGLGAAVLGQLADMTSIGSAAKLRQRR